MIKISDLIKIKKTCFDKIAFDSNAKNNLCVKFSPINDSIIQIVMSNGEDFARIISNVKSPIPEFSVSWLDFSRLCDFFKNEINVKLDENIVKFSELNTKFKCNIASSDANELVNFKFDFDGAKKICLDNALILKEHGAIGCFAMSKDILISTDSNFCIVNKLENFIGDDLFLFNRKIPSGVWYFNPENRIIVSENKMIACTIKKSNAKYPFNGLLNLSKQTLNNWFKVDFKAFKNCIEQCAKINEQILFELKNDSIFISAKSKEFGEFKTEIKAEFDHVSSKNKIKFSYKYLTMLCYGEQEGALKINFDDNPSEYKLQVINDNLVMYGMGMI